MDHHVSVLGDLGLVLVVASIASVLFRLLKLPTLLGYLVTGLAVGPYIPIPIFADLHRIEALAEFGVVDADHGGFAHIAEQRELAALGLGNFPVGAHQKKT